jgi:hypothetical protein
MKSDLMELIETHPRTPEGIELYKVVIGQSSAHGTPLPMEFAEGPEIEVGWDEEVPLEYPNPTIHRISPQVVDRHAGEGWIFGWSEELRVLVIWPDVWTGVGARGKPPRLG